MRRPKFLFPKVTLALAMLGFGGYGVGDFAWFEAKSIEAPAVVVDTHQHVHSSSKRGGQISTYQPVVRFTPKGSPASVTATSTNESATFGYQRGTDVKVEYLPEFPEKTVRIKAGIDWLDFLMAIAGAAFLYFTVESYVMWRRSFGSRVSTAV